MQAQARVEAVMAFTTWTLPHNRMRPSKCYIKVIHGQAVYCVTRVDVDLYRLDCDLANKRTFTSLQQAKLALKGSWLNVILSARELVGTRSTPQDLEIQIVSLRGKVIWSRLYTEDPLKLLAHTRG